MPTKLSKQVFAAIEKLGFEYVWTSGQGIPCYVHPDDPNQIEVSVNASINNETSARAKIRDCQKIAGHLPKIEKRRGTQVKERHAAERERAQQRLRWAEEKRERILADSADEDHLRKLDELIELRRRQLLALHREMSEGPQGSQHLGRGRVEYIGTATNRTPL